MNTLRGCFRLSFAVLNKPSFLRPFCPASIKPERLCSKQNLHVDQFDDFEDSCPGHELFENIDVASIVGDDEEMKKKLQLMILELSMTLQTETLLAPKQLKPREWRTLLGIKKNDHRLRYLQNLYVREKRKETWDFIAQNKREELKRLEENKIDGPLTTSSPVNYCLQNTTLFYRVNPRALHTKFNFNLALAMMFGEDLIVDCSYEEFMNQSGINSSARQISYMFSNNRESKNPFNLVLCNLDKNGKLMEALKKQFSALDRDDYFITLTEKHYLDLYPAEKLIYMTPHCVNDMEKYEEDCVYILGAYVDEGGHTPVSMAKAKKYGVRAVRLPLDKELNWATGSKLLPFNVCARVLNDVKDGACWQYALRHLHVRKQKFQFFHNDIDIKEEQSLAAASVREEVKRNMRYDFGFRGYHKHTQTPSTPIDVNDNENEYSANDKF